VGKRNWNRPWRNRDFLIQYFDRLSFSAKKIFLSTTLPGRCAVFLFLASLAMAGIGFIVGKLIGKLFGDVMVTREEINGLMEDLLYVDSPPAGKTKLTDWAREHADSLGRRYTSELARRRDRSSGYENKR
jgi:hypothetical protein